jgi:hypothetical protein
MQRDISIICGGFLAFGLVLWAFWGNPENPPQTHTASISFKPIPTCDLVSERSPYRPSPSAFRRAAI